MENKEHRRLLSDFEDEILHLIDHADDFTRSDLQGIVMALVRRIMQAGRASQTSALEYPRLLPRIKIGKTIYFVDERLRQLRNVDNPHDFIDYGDDFAGAVRVLEAMAAHRA
jgi:hypothetical protein